MAKNRRYYFLKLKEGFFEQDTIVLMESMKEGVLYSNILMKMYLKSLQYEGFLKLNEQVSMTPEMIATLTRHEIGTVERALKVFMQLGLAEMTDTGTIFMTQIDTMIGNSTTEADRKAISRARVEKEQSVPLIISTSGQGADICPQNVRLLSADSPQSVPDVSENCPTEYRDKSKEIRDQILESERGDAPTRTKQKKLYGKYQNVRLSDNELETLKADYPAEYEDMIENLSQYMASTGKKYHNHLATMEKWKKEDLEKQDKAGGYCYNDSYRKGESL